MLRILVPLAIFSFGCATKPTGSTYQRTTASEEASPAVEIRKQWNLNCSLDNEKKKGPKKDSQVLAISYNDRFADGDPVVAESSDELYWIPYYLLKSADGKVLNFYKYTKKSEQGTGDDDAKSEGTAAQLEKKGTVFYLMAEKTKLASFEISGPTLDPTKEGNKDHVRGTLTYSNGKSVSMTCSRYAGEKKM